MDVINPKKNLNIDTSHRSRKKIEQRKVDIPKDEHIQRLLYSFLPTICARKKIIINSWIRKPRRYIDNVALTTTCFCTTCFKMLFFKIALHVFAPLAHTK